MPDRKVASPLAAYIDVKHGFAFEGRYFCDEASAHVLVTPGNFAIGGGFQEGRAKYYNGPIPEDYILRGGDLVVTMTDLSKAGDTLGYPALIPSHTDRIYLHNQRIGLVSITDRDLLNRDYLYYLLRTDAFRNHILATASGSTVRHTSPSRIREFAVDLPNLREQRAAAEVLRTLDDKIEQNRRTGLALEKLARGTFKAWFVDFEPVKAKAAGATAFPGMSNDTFATLPTRFVASDLGRVPEGWKVRSLEDCVTELIDHRGKTPKKLGGDWAQRGIPALSAKNVKAGRVIRAELNNFVDDEMFRRWMPIPLKLNDVVVTSEAPLGELVYLARNANYCLSQRVFGIRANRAVVEPSYLYHFLESADAQTQLAGRASGTTVLGIRQSELRQITIPVAPLDIQKSAAELLQTCADIVAQLDESSDKFASLRDYLLPRLLSGRARVTHVKRIEKPL